MGATIIKTIVDFIVFRGLLNIFVYIGKAGKNIIYKSIYILYIVFIYSVYIISI